MQNSRESSMLSGIIKGNIIGTIALALIVAAFTMVLFKSGADKKIYFPALSAASALAGAIGGFFGTRDRRKNGVASGLVSGIIPALALIIAMSALHKGFSAYELIPLGITLFAGIVGGIAAVNMKKKNRRIKK